MSNILARSPFIVSVNEGGQTGSKIDVFIWNGTGSAPAFPQYTLSKLIPASNILLTTYNVSPYIREYLSFPNFPNAFGGVNPATPTTAWCNVVIKRYKSVDGVFTILDTTTYKAFDGYSYYASGSNVAGSSYLLDEGNYNYNYDSTADLTTEPLKRAGQFTFLAISGFSVKYSEIGTANFLIVNLFTTQVQDMRKVNSAYMAKGNKVEIINASSVVQWTAYFYPVSECKYTPVVIDFVNKNGSWQREFFMKASRDSFNMENSEFNLMQSNLVNYSVLEGQRKSFNSNGKESIKVNTGWVAESFGLILKQIMLSERILINNRPAMINTKSIELMTHINNKNINYEIEFMFAHETINSVV